MGDREKAIAALEKAPLTKEEVFASLRMLIERPENYIPRDYHTMGGMWTVDTWKLGDVSFQVMDEGYTFRLRGPGFEAYDDSIDGVRITHGELEGMRQVLLSLRQQMER